MLKLAIINPNEQDLIDKIQSSNPDENSIWKIPNLLIPIFTIVLALLCNLAFSKNRYCFISYVNLIINGSLPLIAINQISALGILLFDFDRSKEVKYNILNTKNLRVKLFYYSLGILVIGVLAFAHQVINNPFKAYLEPLIVFVISVFLILASSYVSKNIFMLQDSMISKTFDKEIIDEIKDKGHGQKW